MAEGFLSVHMLPEMATRTRSGNWISNTSIAFKHPFDTFIGIKRGGKDMESIGESKEGNHRSTKKAIKW